jgi:N-glycosylase/DNA lyase
MSKQVYEETQEFLADKWGPLGGWAQAVMFAADLKPVTPKKSKTEWRTPAKLGSTGVKTEPGSPSSTYDDSPLKRKAGEQLQRTRSATRTSLKRTESDLVVDDVEEKLKL